jgi:hypothetical protein
VKVTIVQLSFVVLSVSIPDSDPIGSPAEFIYISYLTHPDSLLLEEKTCTAPIAIS